MFETTTPVLIRESRLAVQRAKRARRKRHPVAEGGAVFTAIVTAAGAVETYLSELLAHLAHVRWIDRREREKVRKESGVAKKFQRLACIWRKDLSKDPIYQPLGALMTLRNVLIHRSAEFLPANQWPEELASFRRTIPHEQGHGLDWTSQVLGLSTAEWASDTAWRFFKRFDDYVPDPSRPPFISG